MELCYCTILLVNLQCITATEIWIHTGFLWIYITCCELNVITTNLLKCNGISHLLICIDMKKCGFTLHHLDSHGIMLFYKPSCEFKMHLDHCNVNAHESNVDSHIFQVHSYGISLLHKYSCDFTIYLHNRNVNSHQFMWIYMKICEPVFSHMNSHEQMWIHTSSM